MPEWRPIPGWPDYQASDDGRIRSRKCMKAQRPTSRGDYLCVDLYRDGERTTHRVHRLVLAAFEGWRKYPVWEAMHLDGDQQNNALENLEWGTPEQNREERWARYAGGGGLDYFDVKGCA